ncbi:MAG: DUF362 domain-containing protein [Candidatus Gracilibacteria bacterium]
MENNTLNPRVALIWTDKAYPEFPYDENSALHKALKDLFKALGVPPENPFKDSIKPGETALIKPNWVMHTHPNEKNLDCLISHTSLIRYLIDFLAKAMQGQGTIVLGDSPLQSCDLPKLLDRSHIHEVLTNARQQYPQIQFVIEDWRLTHYKNKPIPLDDFGNIQSSKHQIIDLKQKSFLEDIRDYSNQFRITCYKPSLLKKHHAPGKHEYFIANRVFDADFIINLPKMKTHIKAGLTGALKNLIGINGHKEYLPHHIKGPYFKGGDNYLMPNKIREYHENVYDYFWEHSSEMSSLKRNLFSFWLNVLLVLSFILGKEIISAGQWRCNETIWRTTLDLNQILYFFGPKRPRKILTILDGIIAGERQGPLCPQAKKIGVLIGGENPAHVDAIAAQLMGYNVSRIPTVYHALYHRNSCFGGTSLEELSIFSNTQGPELSKISFFDLPNLHFQKPLFWVGASLNDKD